MNNNEAMQTSATGCFVMPKFSKECLLKAFDNPYTTYTIAKNGKRRKLEAPNKTLKDIQKGLNGMFQERFPCPAYCFSGWKGKNNIKNAQMHVGKREVITADISHFFPNSKEDYVKQFYEELGVYGKDLELLLKLTTFKGHLPTGAPTSVTLSTLIHKKLFDTIYNNMQQHGIDFSLYVDDMTLSSNKHIPSNVIPYIKNVLAAHSLHLKSTKIKRFGYKGAHITGIRTTQAGKLQMPYKKGHEIIQMLQEIPVEQMWEPDLSTLIGKINYMQQIYPKDSKNKPFQATKRKAYKRKNEILKYCWV